MVTARQAGRARRAPEEQAGYTLAALMIFIMVMSIMMSAALPHWTTYVQREREEEAIFRGLQYAEAIRVFQKRHGRQPTTLEELIKVEPRSIRQLWDNPLNESGEWGLLMQAQPQAQGAQQAGRRADQARAAGPGGAAQQGAATARQGRGGVVAIPPGGEDDGRNRGSSRRPGARTRTTGPIVGVYPGIEGEGLKTFNGARTYTEWRFQVDLIPAPVMTGGDAPAPRVTSAWIGKPFRSDLQVQPRTGAQPQQGQGLTGPQGDPSPGAGRRGSERLRNLFDERRERSGGQGRARTGSADGRVDDGA